MTLGMFSLSVNDMTYKSLTMNFPVWEAVFFRALSGSIISIFLVYRSGIISIKTKKPVRHFVRASSAAAECVTLQAAGGFNIHLFPTGQGNIIGNPIEPVIKLTANPLTAKTMSEHIDVDVSKILSREMNLSQAGDELIKSTLRVANGRLTCAEALGHKEFVMTKLYRSA